MEKKLKETMDKIEKRKPMFLKLRVSRPLITKARRGSEERRKRVENDKKWTR